LPEVQRTPVENHCPTEIQFVWLYTVIFYKLVYAWL
jgi:hypothetical protein